MTTLGNTTIFNSRTEPILKAHELACRRGGEWLFADMSFEIYPGQLVWLQGQNGRGKTSLLRLLVGLAEPDRGTLSWHGEPLREAPDFKENLVYIGHTNGLKDDLTVTESLQFLARLHNRDDSPLSVSSALHTLAMQHRAQVLVRTLSQGQRRRVALARLALERRPSLWVLDEPFDALDAEGIRVVNRLLLAHTARGGCVFLTSHLPLSLDASRVHPLDFPHGRAP
jgi:heme exporter protein A